MEKPDQSGLDIQDNLAKNKGNLAWTSGKGEQDAAELAANTNANHICTKYF